LGILNLANYTQENQISVEAQRVIDAHKLAALNLAKKQPISSEKQAGFVVVPIAQTLSSQPKAGSEDTESHFGTHQIEFARSHHLPSVPAPAATPTPVVALYEGPVSPAQGDRIQGGQE